MTPVGKILILPKGRYDADTVYKMLDLVMHNGTSWIAKKTVVDIEPSEENAEYWQKLVDIGDAIDHGIEEFFGSGDSSLPLTIPSLTLYNSDNADMRGTLGVDEKGSLVFGDSTIFNTLNFGTLVSEYKEKHINTYSPVYVYTTPGTYEFTVERTGSYKITAVGGGAGGGKSLTNYYHPCGGGGGAGAISFKSLKKGDVLKISVGAGGRGLYLDGEGKPINAEKGGDTEITLGGVRLVLAQGGEVGNDSRAYSEGGDLSFAGGFPRAKGLVILSDSTSDSTSVTFDIGGSSILGEGAAFEGDFAGIGGGGYASIRSGSNYTEGGRGGDGGAVIEYLS